jgi:hypothetical protein
MEYEEYEKRYVRKINVESNKILYFSMNSFMKIGKDPIIFVAMVDFF